MNKSESKYFNTAVRMDTSFIALLEKKSFEYITVKEICAASGVNRSTFYLHYETINDLLKEAAEYSGSQFFSRFVNQRVDHAFIQTAPKENLIFITEEFLYPYLSFVKENKTLYRAVLKHFESIQFGENMYKGIYRAMNEVMERFEIPSEKRTYMIRFYLEGINAVIKEWLEHDCNTELSMMIQIIKECVRAE